jgi:hypothetical protein
MYYSGYHTSPCEDYAMIDNNAELFTELNNIVQDLTIIIYIYRSQIRLNRPTIIEVFLNIGLI